MSISRVTALGASFVWSVESTRCPVSDAWIAISAVSRSRISPISTTSGSCRMIERSADAKVRPAFSFTCTCTIPGQPILDRILDRDDVDAALLEPPQRGVERRRLARAGWPGDEDQTFAALQQSLDAFQLVGDETPFPRA